MNAPTPLCGDVRELSPEECRRIAGLVSVKRLRHREVLIDFILGLAKGMDVDAAALAAGKKQGLGRARRTRSEKQILHDTKRILERHDVTRAARDYYEVAADFTPVDAARMLVRHINGEIEEERIIQTKDGVEKVTVKVRPSLDALKHYDTTVLPKAPKQVQVDQRVLVRKDFITDEPPKIRARALEPKAIESGK